MHEIEKFMGQNMRVFYDFCRFMVYKRHHMTYMMSFFVLWVIIV